MFFATVFAFPRESGGRSNTLLLHTVEAGNATRDRADPHGGAKGI